MTAEWHPNYDLPRYGIAVHEGGDYWTVEPIYGFVTVHHVPGDVLRAQRHYTTRSYYWNLTPKSS